MVIYKLARGFLLMECEYIGRANFHFFLSLIVRISCPCWLIMQWLLFFDRVANTDDLVRFEVNHGHDDMFGPAHIPASSA